MALGGGAGRGRAVPSRAAAAPCRTRGAAPAPGGRGAMGKSRARRFRRAPPAPSGPEQGDPEEEPAAELLEKVSAEPDPAAAVAAGGGPRGCGRGCGAGWGYRGGERGPPVPGPGSCPAPAGRCPAAWPRHCRRCLPPGLAPLLEARAGPGGGALKPVLPPPASSEGFVRVGRAAGICRPWEVNGKVLKMAGCRHSFASFLWFGRYT